MLDKLHGYLFNKNHSTCCKGGGPNMYLGLYYMPVLHVLNDIKVDKT